MQSAPPSRRSRSRRSRLHLSSSMLVGRSPLRRSHADLAHVHEQLVDAFLPCALKLSAWCSTSRVNSSTCSPFTRCRCQLGWVGLPGVMVCCSLVHMRSSGPCGMRLLASEVGIMT
eukprot:1377877-Pyramimonas_sp.AAC.1